MKNNGRRTGFDTDRELTRDPHSLTFVCDNIFSLERLATRGWDEQYQEKKYRPLVKPFLYRAIHFYQTFISNQFNWAFIDIIQEPETKHDNQTCYFLFDASYFFFIRVFLYFLIVWVLSPWA